MAIMTITEVYDRYLIMPNLRQHMLRVAGVADWIAGKLEQQGLPVERDNAVLATLLHDLGNIVKFDLMYFPEFLEPEGFEFWQKVQQETKAKYGDNAHQATVAMVSELGVSSRVIELIDAISFNKAKQNRDSNDWSAKVVAYSDMRVAPLGVVTMQERLDDGFKRYEKRGASSGFSYAMGACLRTIERQLAEAGKFMPEEVTEEALVNRLDYFLSTKVQS